MGISFDPGLRVTFTPLDSGLWNLGVTLNGVLETFVPGGGAWPGIGGLT
jgi:hypothetical protein